MNILNLIIEKFFLKKENRAQINIKLRDCNFSKHLYKDSTYLNNGAHMFSVIQMNNDYIDLSDLSYHNCGFYNMVIIYYSLFGLSIFHIFNRGFLSNPLVVLDNIFPNFIAFIFIFFLFLVHYKSDNTGYSHYPIRINRKTKKVYYMDFDGVFHELNWDDVDFYISKKDHVAGYYLEMCVIDENEMVTHRSNIGMSSSVQKIPEEIFYFIINFVKNGPENLFPYYENYMEENENKMLEKLTFCNDVNNKRESKKFSIYRINVRNYGSIFFNAFSFLIFRTFFLYIGRMYAMSKLKVPVWPEWIENKNKIRKDDPYIVNAEINEYFKYKPSVRKISLEKRLPDRFFIQNKKKMTIKKYK